MFWIEGFLHGEQVRYGGMRGGSPSWVPAYHIDDAQYYEDRNTALAVKKVLKRDTAVTNLRIGRGMGS